MCFGCLCSIWSGKRRRCVQREPHGHRICRCCERPAVSSLTSSLSGSYISRSMLTAASLQVIPLCPHREAIFCLSDSGTGCTIDIWMQHFSSVCQTRPACNFCGVAEADVCCVLPDSVQKAVRLILVWGLRGINRTDLACNIISNILHYCCGFRHISGHYPALTSVLVSLWFTENVICGLEFGGMDLIY